VRILFISATRVGDAVISTGILNHLIQRHPEARVTVVCGPVAEGVFARMPNRERTIILAKRKWRLHWWDLLRQVVPRRWDLVVDLRGSATAYLVRAGRRLVYRGSRAEVKPDETPETAPEVVPRVKRLGDLLGLDPPPLPVAWFDAEDQAFAARLLSGPGPWIALGPTANWDRKVWSAEGFIGLFKRLSAPGGALEGARAVVLGGPGAQEAAMAAPVLAALGERAVDLVGRLELPQVAAVMARSALFVGNDSGLMHLAAAAGTSTLGLFGPSRVGEYAPAGKRAGFVAAPQAPALDSMPGLTVEMALAAAERLLGQPIASTEAATQDMPA
jgi:ADP-heptose:LPS heptosyltransferase